jgi:hypothetical protein
VPPRKSPVRAAATAALAALAIAGCASVDPSAYRGEKPALALESYFNGTIDGWGMFQDYSGKVVNRFTVRIDANWSGDRGTLDEDFTFADGTKQRRVWTIVRTAPDRYVGTAADVVGEAQGVQAGNAIRWNYVLALPVDGQVWHMNMDDWMFLVDEKTLLNRTAMRKFGLTVGEVTLSFTRR